MERSASSPSVSSLLEKVQLVERVLILSCSPRSWSPCQHSARSQPTVPAPGAREDAVSCSRSSAPSDSSLTHLRIIADLRKLPKVLLESAALPAALRSCSLAVHLKASDANPTSAPAYASLHHSPSLSLGPCFSHPALPRPSGTGLRPLPRPAPSHPPTQIQTHTPFFQTRTTHYHYSLERSCTPLIVFPISDRAARPTTHHPCPSLVSCESLFRMPDVYCLAFAFRCACRV